MVEIPAGYTLALNNFMDKIIFISIACLIDTNSYICDINQSV